MGVKKGKHFVCLPALPCPASTSRGTRMTTGSSEMVAKHAEAIMKNAEEILKSMQGTITNDDNEANESTIEASDVKSIDEGTIVSL